MIKTTHITDRKNQEQKQKTEKIRKDQRTEKEIRKDRKEQNRNRKTEKIGKIREQELEIRKDRIDQNRNRKQKMELK